MNPSRGDIYWVSLPTSEGREQAGRRPALVIQYDPFTLSLPTVLIVPITSNLRAASFAGTIRIDPSEANGLIAPSVLLVFQLRAIDKRRLSNQAGKLSASQLEEVLKMIDLLLGKNA